MPRLIALPAPLRGITTLQIQREEREDTWTSVAFLSGALVEGQFVVDPDFQQPRLERITGEEFQRFLAWARDEDGKEDAPLYGVLYDTRSVLRWIAWRQFRARLSPAEWDAMLPALVQFLGTNPPQEP